MDDDSVSILMLDILGGRNNLILGDPDKLFTFGKPP